MEQIHKEEKHFEQTNLFKAILTLTLPSMKRLTLSEKNSSSSNGSMDTMRTLLMQIKSLYLHELVQLNNLFKLNALILLLMETYQLNSFLQQRQRSKNNVKNLISLSSTRFYKGFHEFLKYHSSQLLENTEKIVK